MIKGMRFIFLLLVLAACNGNADSGKAKDVLKEVTKGDFYVGTALNTPQIMGLDSQSIQIVKQHFNAIVPENCMKSSVIHPEEDRYDFDLADRFVKFGEENNMFCTGHCLIWHSQLARWFCVDKEGNNVSKEILIERMKNHIYTVVGRYKGKIKGWDVVNEAIVEDGSYRNTKFYQILGEEYIPLAFKFAHEADPDAELYYNDYGMDVKGRRESVVRLVKQLKEKGLRIDAVGMQGHMGMDYPKMEEFEKSMLAFAAEGVKVMITEWDMSALPTVSMGANISDTVAMKKVLNPYPTGLPDSVSKAWNDRVESFFNLFMKHADIVTRFTAWGVTDRDSWKNNFPVKGRVDYPLLFDRNYQPKPFIGNLLKK